MGTGIMFFIGNMSRFGGTERVLSVIAGGLYGRGYRVSVVSLWGATQPGFQCDAGIRIYWVERERKHFGIWGNLQCLKELVLRENPDFLIDVDIILGCYSFFIKLWRPQLCWISWEHFQYEYHFEKNNLLRKMVRRVAASHSDQMIVLTDEDKAQYQKKLKLRCRLNRIYNPVPFEYVYVNDKDSREERFMILAAGRLTWAKGFDLLIKSWKLLESKYPRWSIVVVGEGRDRRKLEKQIRMAGLRRFYLAGAASDMEEYYKKASFFVFPSREEGFGMVLLEAMCFSLPVVSSCCKAGPREIVLHGVNGFLAETGNPEAFAQRMEQLMRDSGLRRTMGQRAGRIEPKFNRERILDEWEALLTGLAAERSIRSRRRKTHPESSGTKNQE